MSKPVQLAFMEMAEWWRGNQIASARPLVQILSQFEHQNPSYFPYSTFVDKESFLATLKHYHNKVNIRYIHIGCHGNPKGLKADNKLISSISISETLHRYKLRGLFISACESNKIAYELTDGFDQSAWVAGYGKKVDWLDSTAFEILFWRTFLEKSDKDSKGKIRATKRGIKNTLNALCCDGYKDVMNKLKLHVYYRGKKNRKESHKPENLIESTWFEDFKYPSYKR